MRRNGMDCGARPRSGQIILKLTQKTHSTWWIRSFFFSYFNFLKYKISKDRSSCSSRSFSLLPVFTSPLWFWSVVSLFFGFIFTWSEESCVPPFCLWIMTVVNNRWFLSFHLLQCEQTETAHRIVFVSCSVPVQPAACCHLFFLMYG